MLRWLLMACLTSPTSVDGAERGRVHFFEFGGVIALVASISSNASIARLLYPVYATEFNGVMVPADYWSDGSDY